MGFDLNDALSSLYRSCTHGLAHWAIDEIAVLNTSPSVLWIQNLNQCYWSNASQR